VDPGYENLLKSELVRSFILKFASEGKVLGAICAAPMVLARAGVLKDRIATIYPGFEKELDRPRDDRVVEDGNIITSRGPGTAMEFALKLVEKLFGPEKARQLRERMVV